MAANILNSPRAVAMRVYLLRAFATSGSGCAAVEVSCILRFTFNNTLCPRRPRPNPRSGPTSKRAPSPALRQGSAGWGLCPESA